MLFCFRAWRSPLPLPPSRGSLIDLLRYPDDQPTIGLILCGSRERITAEYALRNFNTPIAIATHHLPDPLQAQLPTVEQLEMVLGVAMAQKHLGSSAGG